MKVDVPSFEIVENIKLNPQTTALIIVDMQNDFVHPNGSLYVPGSEKIIPHIKLLLEKAREKNVTVVYTQDSHMENDIEFRIWSRHAVKGTWGWQIVDDLKPRPNDLIIEKLRYDAFFGTPLDHLLRLRNISTLIVTGVVANICVLHTAASGALLGYKIVLPLDTTIALNDFDYYATLRQISFLYKGILVKKAENIAFG